jgi:prepilin-type N-terminal cleavage/methylation domain-containing protein
MTSLKNKQQGFTIVELLIVIVVIGILAALVITTFSGIQKSARDAERQTDIVAIHGQLEAYYAKEGAYPALAQLNDATWRDDNMKGLDSDALQDPKGSAATLVAAPAANSYSYAVSTEAGAACTTAAKDCEQYTLTSTNEGDDPATHVKTSLN